MGLFACITAPAALAADCPGHPDALGTSRTLVVDPREHPRLGIMQYPETLPLADHEVVLTFDDGPLPRNSNQVLEILAAQCVKATFFEIGRMAQAFPEGVRKLRDAGHTIGTHTQSHPLTMDRMPIERAKQEINDGIASVKAALGDDEAALAPFLRIPGLLRAESVEQYLASEGIQTWSADFLADDWRHISSSRVYDLAISRLEARGKGILLLHDIQSRTVAALPRILNELKARGFRIVHVVPATPELPATPTEPQQWQLHPPSENVAISHWPKIPQFVFPETDTPAVALMSDFNWLDARPIALAAFDRTRQPAQSLSVPREALWPRLSALPPENEATPALPAPAQDVFEMQDELHAALEGLGSSPRRPERTRREADARRDTADAGYSRHMIRGKLRLAHDRRHGGHRVAVRETRRATAGRRGALKHMVQVRKKRRATL
jgi:peptidoglycan-N-acetylglucosamine deacetylase